MPPLLRIIEPGDVIGRCRAVRELGRGGVGTVFLAMHQTLQIEVALKVLSPSLSMENPALAERFIREAQLAARIRHPNVIAVMDAAHDEATGLYYIVMEYVGGGSLSWHLRHGPLPEAKALAIVTGIAHALVLAEENLIVHRDIKPDNIMLDPRGTAKLADLGLAKHSPDSRTTLTIGGSFMGTPAYMSPEQARDAKVADTRDDIYSLGASFYECLTGRPPFQGETPYNIMSELLTKPSPRPSELRPDVSRSADLICRKMMAKTRELRYPDARALLRDLQHGQIYGDAGLDRLDAASFEQDARAVQREASQLGVVTPGDGATVPPTPRAGARVRGLAPSEQHSDVSVYVAAVVLIVLVTAAAILLAWVGSQRPVAYFKSEFALLSGAPKTSPLPAPGRSHKPDEAAAAPKESETPRALPADNVPPDAAPAIPATEAMNEEPPVAQPANPADLTNAAAATPVIPYAPGAVLPATSASTPDSAFVARSIAENSLGETSTPTGHAELLRIIGKRDVTSLMPLTWTFYFFDRNAAGNARIVTVSGSKVTKSGEDMVDFATPYNEQLVLPEDKLLVDSPQALQIAETLVPGMAVTTSEFVLLQPRNSVPMWKVTLWNRDADGESHRLGEATILAENGLFITKKLEP